MSRGCNERYLASLASLASPASLASLASLAAVAATTPLKDLAEPLCRPTRYHPLPPATTRYQGPKSEQARRVRGPNPLAEADAGLLAAVARGEFAVNGFRNKDLRPLLHTAAQAAKAQRDKAEARRQSAAVTRGLRMLRAHGLIRKLPKSHRYQLTDSGRQAITALLAARTADTAKLSAAAA